MANFVLKCPWQLWHDFHWKKRHKLFDLTDNLQQKYFSLTLLNTEVINFDFPRSVCFSWTRYFVRSTERFKHDIIKILPDASDELCAGGGSGGSRALFGFTSDMVACPPNLWGQQEGGKSLNGNQMFRPWVVKVVETNRELGSSVHYKYCVVTSNSWKF